MKVIADMVLGGNELKGNMDTALRLFSWVSYGGMNCPWNSYCMIMHDMIESDQAYQVVAQAGEKNKRTIISDMTDAVLLHDKHD
jgi:hypothetical protein